MGGDDLLTFDFETIVSFSEALEIGKKTDTKIHSGNPDDLILLCYTGGTTGTSKGVMLTNRNIIANTL